MKEQIYSPRARQDMETIKSDESKTVQSSIKSFLQPANDEITALTGQDISVQTNEMVFSPIAVNKPT
eukprot:CAMPEP_0194183080 /NCGR_PEP_ID=MMETSP0154-20130528/29407_1 /TAXON_ID=1049557 /ORGANISM="Thalassiothrix antarctica, Strain L6-D1" /LENGTH=66 /DNA_ID=CAMNT_0038899811 /DNA_START=347 /DNA_END=543 /DNA_ORIENTATION=-